MDKFGKLRKIENKEIYLMLEWRNHSKVRMNMYTQHKISLDEHEKWWITMQTTKESRYFMYEFQGVPLGIVAFTNIRTNNKNSSWAFYASPEAPKGTGTKMEFLALNFAFDILKLHKLNCEVLVFNTPVIKLHKKFGFKEEGLFRDQYYLGNKFISVCRLGILESEWAIKKETMGKRIELMQSRQANG